MPPRPVRRPVRLVPGTHVTVTIGGVARHGVVQSGPVLATVRITVGADDVALSVTNPLGRTAGRHAGESRGLAGMAERVRVLRGELATGPAEGGWRVAARLPVAAGPTTR